jgi:hypothetical protein
VWIKITEATCTDGILNQDELDVDCGGPRCGACPFPPGERPVCPRHALTCTKAYVGGSGLILLLNYAGAAGFYRVSKLGGLPLNVESYTHAKATVAFGGDGVVNDVTEARFYCTTSAHGRVVSFKTTDRTLLDSVARNSFTAGPTNTWAISTTRLWVVDAARAYLPSAATEQSISLTEHTFFKPDTYHWNAGSGGAHWECDDNAQGYKYTTLHRVWIKITEATCTDGIQNQGERGIDCGGPCTKCCPGFYGTTSCAPCTVFPCDPVTGGRTPTSVDIGWVNDCGPYWIGCPSGQTQYIARRCDTGAWVGIVACGVSLTGACGARQTCL